MEEAITITTERLIESWVADILHRYELEINHPVPLPIPILDIVERLFAIRCDEEEFRGKYDSASGILIPKIRWMILKKNEHTTRATFTVAHEMAHWLIDGQEHWRGSHGLEYITGLHSDNARVREQRANYVASVLLMPKHIVLNEIRRLLMEGRSTIVELSDVFGMSFRAMLIRLEQLGCVVDGSGLRLPLFGINDCPYINYQYKPKDFLQSRSRTILVDVDFSVIDHELLRKLLSLKVDGRSIFVIATERNADSVEALLELNCVDGIATIENDLAKKLEKHDYDNSQKDYELLALKTGRWVEKIQQECSRIDNRDSIGSIILFSRADGTYVVMQGSFLDSNKYITPNTRLKYRMDASRFIRNEKKTGKRVVVATGCFDLITIAHVRFLKRAKALGDILVVGLEDDTRIRAFKGPLHPVNAISQRVELMEAFDFVDYVFVIGGSPKMEVKPFYTRLHQTIGADILAITEGDPNLQDRNNEIEAAGGKLVVVRRLGDGSSTSLIRRFLAKTELSEFLIATKDNLRGYVAENIAKDKTSWQQLRLPLDHCSHD